MPERSRRFGVRPAIVLLVEDNENDIELTRIGFEQSGLSVDLEVVRDGEECLAFLRRQGSYANAAVPDLVLLDLHMPKMGGMEVLETMSSEDALRHIPVVILTTSSDEREITEAYRRNCRGYLLKPVGFTEFVRTVRALGEYWFNLVELPKG